MTCREAQALITKYVQNQLDLNTLEDFLQHVTNCPDCLEELEVYYIVFNGIKRLDEDENIAVNYHSEFEAELKRNELRIKKAKTRYHTKRLIYLSICLVALVAYSFRVASEESKKKLTYKVEGESTYDLPNYFFKEKETSLDQIAAGMRSSNSSNTTNQNEEVRSNQ